MGELRPLPAHVQQMTSASFTTFFANWSRKQWLKECSSGGQLSREVIPLFLAWRPHLEGQSPPSGVIVGLFPSVSLRDPLGARMIKAATHATVSALTQLLSLFYHCFNLNALWMLLHFVLKRALLQFLLMRYSATLYQ